MASKTKANTRKAAAGVQRDGRFGMLIKPQGDVKRGVTVRFGGVTVIAPSPDAKALKQQLAESKRVVSQLKKVLANPGIKIARAVDVPLFRADPRDPSLVIRLLNGKTERGRIINGQFVPITVP